MPTDHDLTPEQEMALRLALYYIRGYESPAKGADKSLLDSLTIAAVSLAEARGFKAGQERMREAAAAESRRQQFGQLLGSQHQEWNAACSSVAACISDLPIEEADHE